MVHEQTAAVGLPEGSIRGQSWRRSKEGDRLYSAVAACDRAPCRHCLSGQRGILGDLFNLLARHLVHGGLDAQWEVVDADRAIVHVLQLRVSDVSTALSGDFCEGRPSGEFSLRPEGRVDGERKGIRGAASWTRRTRKRHHDKHLATDPCPTGGQPLETDLWTSGRIRPVEVDKQRDMGKWRTGLDLDRRNFNIPLTA
jgi:hypothetical protein